MAAEHTITTWFGSVSGEVTEWDHDSVFVSSEPRSSGTISLRERQTPFSSSICWPRCELQRLRNPCHWHQCCIYARSNRWGNSCESDFRHQEFQILETQGSSEWNKESFNALARTFIWQVCEIHVVPTEPCIYKRFFWQSRFVTAQWWFSCMLISISFGLFGRWIQGIFLVKKADNCEFEAWTSDRNPFSQSSTLRG